MAASTEGETLHLDQTPGKPWAKPTIRCLVAGFFGDQPPDGVNRAGFYEGVAGTGNYPPTSESVYLNPPS